MMLAYVMVIVRHTGHLCSKLNSVTLKQKETCVLKFLYKTIKGCKKIGSGQVK